MDSTAIKIPCFRKGDDGLASIADMEAGFSGNQQSNHTLISRSFCPIRRRSSVRNLSTSSSARFYDARYEDYQPHFLEACFLCKKPLSDNKDIFMYRGDTPFCSEECRQEQIESDEAKEKNWNMSSSRKALRKKDQRKSTSPPKTQDYSFRTSTVAAA